MLHPFDKTFRRFDSVRDGRPAPVTCATCGCRLDRRAGAESWSHFNPLGGRDARGCAVPCADAAHDARGRSLD